MDIAAIASEASFDAFSVSAELNNYCVDVVIDRSVEVADTDGNVRYVAAMVSAKVGDLPDWSPGDLLEAAEGNFRLIQKIADDGYIQKIEANPVA